MLRMTRCCFSRARRCRLAAAAYFTMPLLMFSPPPLAADADAAAALLLVAAAAMRVYAVTRLRVADDFSYAGAADTRRSRYLCRHIQRLETYMLIRAADLPPRHYFAAYATEDMSAERNTNTYWDIDRTIR